MHSKFMRRAAALVFGLVVASLAGCYHHEYGYGYGGGPVLVVEGPHHHHHHHHHW